MLGHFFGVRKITAMLNWELHVFDLSPDILKEEYDTTTAPVPLHAPQKWHEEYVSDYRMPATSQLLLQWQKVQLFRLKFWRTKNLLMRLWNCSSHLGNDETIVYIQNLTQFDRETEKIWLESDISTRRTKKSDQTQKGSCANYSANSNNSLLRFTVWSP